MNDDRRNQLLNVVEREMIGPDPIEWEGHKQDNGEEILTVDPPRTRYIAGVLFPKQTTDTAVESGEENTIPEILIEEIEIEKLIDESLQCSNVNDHQQESLEDAEELINRSNAYRQSAISITAALHKGDEIRIEVQAGTYKTKKFVDPITGKETTRYPRTAISWTNDGYPIDLPSGEDVIRKIPIDDSGLQFDITHRYQLGSESIYTFTLENANVCEGSLVKDDDCFFQVKFKIFSTKGFCPLPDSQKINTSDEDYLSNLLLYRNVHNYALGHGCAVDWEEDAKIISWIASATFPSYEIKPIVPSVIPGVSLDMLKMSPHGDFIETLSELNDMCDKYQEWIDRLRIESSELNAKYVHTAERHIQNCESCLQRMKNGITLLMENSHVRVAFQYMNLAMLMQQLHFNLPLQQWEDDGIDGIHLVNQIYPLPSTLDNNTWYDRENKVYGKWRPFQLAFILMNLRSMSDRECNERSIVDLIWFPTGGGKTEAYLGLSAYTIFMRRLNNKNDSGTAILMRYTLRLLTAQQFERASAMICACDIIRKEQVDLFGNGRINIGLWVGGSTTPNSMSDAVRRYNELVNGGNENPFVMLKCPWCGAQMGPVTRKNGVVELSGYRKVRGPNRKEKIIFCCSNNLCDFSKGNYALPLHVIDEDIYQTTPTLILGTVDKFAMLPFRPQAQGIFGYKEGIKNSSPDLIIQDELHLISGPLGSMVGHYETMIHELCITRTKSTEIHPKIIASTATISRAKEQCRALYARGPENVFQFPPSGLVAGDSFFAKEDKELNGRRYVGILATASSSDTTTAIRLFSSLLFGAKELQVNAEKERDPYWTNIGYFNSIRELGQAATWIRQDIESHLDVMYKRRFDHKRYSLEDYRRKRRYIWRDEELTSRIRGDKVTESLSNLNIRYPEEINSDGNITSRPIDICLATNMISVGLDVPRLGLMTVFGQPKMTSEYIQATSRVGRDGKRAPGIVFVLYRPGRPRDKSHYEHFRGYHSRIYCNVEPTSVTPFSAPVRERALHALMIGILRLQSSSAFNADPPQVPTHEQIRHIKEIITKRVIDIDRSELDATLARLDEVLEMWEDWQPQLWEPRFKRDFSYDDIVPLMYQAGSNRNAAWGKKGIETPMSMRSVDASCEAEVLANRYSPREV